MYNEENLTWILRNLSEIEESRRIAVRNNGGGHFNHSLFWNGLSPNGGGRPKGELAAAIDRDVGSFDDFRKEFSTAAATRFGSGWSWLSLAQNKLVVTSTPNQDNPLMDNTGIPLLGLDVWEHAYYLRYQNRRPEYVEAFWDIVDWETVSQNFIKMQQVLEIVDLFCDPVALDTGPGPNVHQVNQIDIAC